MKAPYFKKLCQSRVYHDGRTFFVSTADRETSACVAPPLPRYAETLVWEEFDDQEDPWIYDATSAEGSLKKHWEICESLLKTGKWEEQECVR